MGQYVASLDDMASQRFRDMRILKVGAALICGACLGILATSVPVQSTSEAANLASMPTSLRQSSMFSRQGQVLASLPGPSPWKELAIASLEASQNCGRDVAAKARLQSMMMNADSKTKAELARLSVRVQAKKKQVEAEGSDLPGGVAPLGDFWDPLSLAVSANEGQILYFREAELKHGRICMLATVGIYVGERFHPLFGGDIDAFSVSTDLFSAPALGPFWAAILVAAGGIEILRRLAGGKERRHRVLLLSSPQEQFQETSASIRLASKRTSTKRSSR